MEPIRTFVVDDHEIAREGLRWMIGADATIQVVGEAETASEAMQAIVRSLPDVVLLDIHLPDRSGLEVLREMQERFPDLPVVILSMEDDPEYVEQAVRAGAAGYLVKNASRDEMVRAVRAAHAGGGYIQSEVTRPLLARFAREVRAHGDAPHLSPRELEAVSLLAEGLTNRQIADRLGISESTAKGYLRQVYERLGAADRAHAVAIALRSRIID
ncbi:MAG TPA: response regulator transcription factor [Actinomycetota bacterium]